MTVYTVSSILSISSGKIVEKMGWGLSPPAPMTRSIMSGIETLPPKIWWLYKGG